MSLCSICYDKGYVYYQHEEEYQVEVCQCQAPIDTRMQCGIKVPSNSTTVLMDQYGDAVVVIMPNGLWVQYDSDGYDTPWDIKDCQDLIKSITNEEDVIWYDENGSTIFDVLRNYDIKTFPKEINHEVN